MHRLVRLRKIQPSSNNTPRSYLQVGRDQGFKKLSYSSPALVRCFCAPANPESVPRKRGRPRKNPDAVVAATEAEQPKPKRGRPRKVVQPEQQDEQQQLQHTFGQLSSIPLDALQPVVQNGDTGDWDPFPMFKELENYVPSDYVYTPPGEPHQVADNSSEIDDPEGVELFPIFRELYTKAPPAIKKPINPPGQMSEYTQLVASLLKDAKPDQIRGQKAPSEWRTREDIGSWLPGIAATYQAASRADRPRYLTLILTGLKNVEQIYGVGAYITAFSVLRRERTFRVLLDVSSSIATARPDVVIAAIRGLVNLHQGAVVTELIQCVPIQDLNINADGMLLNAKATGGEIYTRVYKAMRRAGVVVPPSHLRSIVLVHFESLGEWPSFKRLMEPFDQWYSSGIITEEEYTSCKLYCYGYKGKLVQGMKFADAAERHITSAEVNCLFDGFRWSRSGATSVFRLLKLARKRPHWRSLIASASIISVVEAGSRCRSIIRRKSLFEKAERLVLWNVSKGEILTDECWQLVFSNIPGSVSRRVLRGIHLLNSLIQQNKAAIPVTVIVVTLLKRNCTTKTMVPIIRQLVEFGLKFGCSTDEMWGGLKYARMTKQQRKSVMQQFLDHGHVEPKTLGAAIKMRFRECNWAAVAHLYSNRQYDELVINDHQHYLMSCEMLSDADAVLKWHTKSLNHSDIVALKIVSLSKMRRFDLIAKLMEEVLSGPQAKEVASKHTMHVFAEACAQFGQWHVYTSTKARCEKL